MTPLEREAAAALDAAFGPGGPPAFATAPGRCTLVGEHVDYADGMVLCVGVDLAVTAAVRPAVAGRYGVAGDGRVAERATPGPAGDVGDLPLAAAVVLAARGVEVPAVEVGVAATLPAGAGLSSSAAVVCATLVALLRMTGWRLPAADVAALALAAERDVVGVPCGPLDQRAVVGAPAGGALLLDCRQGGRDVAVPWNVSGTVLVASHTGDTHDVGGPGYRARREEAAAALAALGAESYRGVDTAVVETSALPERLRRRARHIVGETARAQAAAGALERGDPVALGALMSASHVSLRDDYEVSTPLLDAAVAAATAVPGCHGARLVGAGFGGTAVALVAEQAAAACMAAMRAAAGHAASGRGEWILRPAAGLAVTSPDAVG